MRNFNTNQTRNFYVAGSIDTTHAIDSADFPATGIALKQAATGELYFLYKNADGKPTRSDSFLPTKVTHLKKTEGSALVKPLRAHVIGIYTNAVALADLIGKTLECIITIHQVFDYDMDNSISFVASVVGNSTNTATTSAFNIALAQAIVKAMPKNDPDYPFLKVYIDGTEIKKGTDVSGLNGSEGVVLVEAAQKYVRGKLSGEPCPASVAFRLADRNSGDIVWGVEDPTIKTVAEYNTQVEPTTNISPATISGTFELADLEWFAYGERGDMYRGYLYPNDYDTKYLIDLSKTYNVLNIEFYWSGENENVQKSKRMIQIAAEAKVSNDVITTLYNALYPLVNPYAALEARVTALDQA